MHKEGYKLNQHSKFDKTGGGYWEVEGDHIVAKRNKMISNAVKGNPAVPYAVGDSVLYNTIDSVAEGIISEIRETSYLIQSGSKTVEILHDQVFDKPQGHIF